MKVQRQKTVAKKFILAQRKTDSSVLLDQGIQQKGNKLENYKEFFKYLLLDNELVLERVDG